jgi:hypothetical protein
MGAKQRNLRGITKLRREFTDSVDFIRFFIKSPILSEISSNQRNPGRDLLIFGVLNP